MEEKKIFRSKWKDLSYVHLSACQRCQHKPVMLLQVFVTKGSLFKWDHCVDWGEKKGKHANLNEENKKYIEKTWYLWPQVQAQGPRWHGNTPLFPFRAFMLQRMDNFMALQWHRLVLRLLMQMYSWHSCTPIIVAIEINSVVFSLKGPKL